MSARMVAEMNGMFLSWCLKKVHLGETKYNGWVESCVPVKGECRDPEQFLQQMAEAVASDGVAEHGWDGGS